MQTLLEIEEIKQLKARYFRGIDTANLDLLRTVLAEDVQIRFDSPTYQFEINGMDDAMNFYRNAFTNRRFGMHHPVGVAQDLTSCRLQRPQICRPREIGDPLI